MLEPSDKLAALQQIASAIDAGRPLPPSQGCWLAKAIREYLKTGKRLDRCLNLQVRRGGRWETLHSISRQRERNAFIATWLFQMPAKTRARQARILAGVLKGRYFAYPITPAQLQEFNSVYPDAPRSATQILRIVSAKAQAKPFISPY